MEHKNITEKKAPASNGIAMLLAILLGFILSTTAFVFGVIYLSGMSYVTGGILLGAGIVGWIVFCILCGGLKNINPNEALVFTLFGRYYGTLKEPGYYFVNPFCTAIHPTVNNSISVNATGENNIAVNTFSKKISLKTMTLINTKQKVNDALGNPIIIGVNVIWHVEDPTMAVLNVENYNKFLSVQCDSVIRNIARLYPYDTMEEDTDEKTLRGSSQEIAETMTAELSEKVRNAAARQKIVEGAVSMVKMAIDQLGEEDIVVLDEERKAAMVSNLLVVLCGNKDAQPIVNSGSIY